MAISMYPGDNIQALINLVKSHAGCDEEKSRALWALGQLGAKEALPYLLENYDGIEGTNICIYEAQFARNTLEITARKVRLEHSNSLEPTAPADRTFSERAISAPGCCGLVLLLVTFEYRICKNNEIGIYEI